MESFEDTMYFGDTFEFFYKIEDDFYGESTLEAEVYSIGSQTPLYDTLSTGEANFVELISNNRIRIINRNAPFVMYGDDVLEVVLIYHDYYGKSSSSSMRLHVRSNQPPVVNIACTPLTENGADPHYEYAISAQESYDPDGDDIVAYEYLIDGKVRGVTEGMGYDFIQSQVGDGLAGTGGTYIYATSLSSVKHAFQSDGAHVIRVRCKDSKGMWSRWQLLQIDL